MKRRTFLGGSAVLASPSVLSRAATGRPNVLLILTDQQSNIAMAANGNKNLRTPAMDGLAADGISFTESYCTYPVCSPARSSLMTSRMPHETGVRVNGRPIVAGMPTMGEHFREHGFQTAHAGKWHLPRGFGEPPGFEYLIGGHSLGARMDEPLATACVKYLTEKPKQPFLLVASFMNPHDVCHWIRGHKGSRNYRSTAKFPPARLNMAVDPEEPEYVQFHRTGDYDLMSNSLKISSEWKVDDFRHYLHDYYRMVEDVDRQIGRVLSALRFRGLAENTVVILTADHGEGLGSHRWTQKAAFWEETAKVPLTVSGAGVKARGVVESKSLASGLDVLPTMSDYAGIPSPKGIRGNSLRPVVNGAGWNRRFVVSELSEYGDKTRQGRMLRTSQHKYVVFNGGERPEQLFDLHLDPGEVNNLVRQSDSSAILREHRALLMDWIAETEDDFRLPTKA
jgi:arylsulfatase A-like enzyme